MTNAKSSSRGAKVTARIIIYLVMIMLLALLGLKGFEFGRSIFVSSGIEASPGTDVVVTIPQGADSSYVGNLLYEQGIIENKNLFRIQCLVFEAEFYAGEYKLNTSSNTEDVIESLKAKGDSSAE